MVRPAFTRFLEPGNCSSRALAGAKRVENSHLTLLAGAASYMSCSAHHLKKYGQRTGMDLTGRLVRENYACGTE